MQNRAMMVMEEGSNPIEGEPVYICCWASFTFVR
jgi:hypothetical protein